MVELKFTKWCNFDKFNALEMASASNYPQHYAAKSTQLSVHGTSCLFSVDAVWVTDDDFEQSPAIFTT